MLVLTAVLVLFATSLLGIAVGLGLLLRSTTMLGFVRQMNRWVSTRQALKPLEVPVRLPAIDAGARWLALILIAVGAYATLVLLRVEAPPSLAGLALDALKWSVVAGSMISVVVGLFLLFIPRVWRKVEARANRWYSTRHLQLAADRLYMPLERVAEAFPRAAGAVVLILSLVAALASGLILVARH
ncbi:MAG TPA: hypothetical protein VJT77_08980 [Burkholderiales bacterium]|nr:hypothetical protein [Burkholderiales bacterium]